MERVNSILARLIIAVETMVVLGLLVAPDAHAWWDGISRKSICSILTMKIKQEF